MTDFNSLLVAKKNFGLISCFTQLKSLSLHFYPPALLLCFCLSTSILDMQEAENAQLSFFDVQPYLFAAGGTLL